MRLAALRYLPRARASLSVVAALRISWLVAVAWYELGVFYWSVIGCRWPDASFKHAASEPIHVLLVADPQVIDARSYPGRPWWLMSLSQSIIDNNLRKSWSAAQCFKPDVVVFLGDMMDNGRFASNNEEYRSLYERFTSIFAFSKSQKILYVPGNYDVGLGTSRSFSPQARIRYTTYFGPLNYRTSVANHTFIILDAPGLVEEDYRRAKADLSFEDWNAPPHGTTDFIKHFASEGADQPVILFSHIPLFRPDTASCGPLREKGTIRRGVGHGYQNMLGRHTTEFVLKYLRPSLVFSGDDHDYCEHTHSIALVAEGPEPKVEYVREVTVKSISMVMGIQRPGFQLLSLIPPQEASSKHPSFSYSPCLLPDQLAIYLRRYLPLLLVSLVILGASSFRKRRRSKGDKPACSRNSKNGHTPLDSVIWGTVASCFASKLGKGDTPYVPAFRTANSSYSPYYNADPAAQRSLSARPMAISLGFLRGALNTDDSDDEDNDPMAPISTSSRGARSFGSDRSLTTLSSRTRLGSGRRYQWTWTFVLRGRRRRVTIGLPPRLEGLLCGSADRGKSGRNVAGGLLGAYVRDVLAVAWMPLILYALIAYYMSH